ncbi:VOC family protein [Desulfovibrio sp. TomC]|uniref:VOC family protein n=1 Tax=Desulfovibrio sp. TomC TaxID=1562888 RepID=UPI000573F0AF|nr:VOC family protein [Desulfovibrio sp. TomC]KHK02028.1 Lactoylglutation lyase [Desulfovibrio sp. TomC]
MPIDYRSVCLFVADMDRARLFYEEVLGQSPVHVLAGYVAYPHFCLWATATARRIVFDEDAAAPHGPMGRDNLELYFEDAAIEDAFERVMTRAEVIHPLKKAPWGQRAFRLRDPDGHIVEVAEPMDAVILRLHDTGLGPVEIAGATMMPEGFVRMVLGG